MANLYMSSVNERGSERTLCANKELTVHARGWNTGARVGIIRHDSDGTVTVTVYRTEGSGDAMAKSSIIAEWRE